MKRHPALGVLAVEGIRQLDLAHMTGFSIATVSRTLRKVTPVSPAFRDAVCEALGMPEEVLFDADS